MELYSKYLDIEPSVKKALDKGLAVVALESTIISHGMPYPQNVETARYLENIVKENGATPATIAIINGRIKIGLNKDELEYLGSANNIAKVSRRDIAAIVSSGKSGATTVAATMFFAQMAGIKVFATGGIGGVHRGAQTSFDISCDLLELSKTNVNVVCAGVKSILDIGLTLEKLETLGVPVIGYKTNKFPAFFTRDSGFNVDYRFDTAMDIAKMIKTKIDLNLDGGALISNPIPEEYEADGSLINSAINQALDDADKNNIKGKNITPFLLDRVKNITEGKSLESNIALVKNNAKLASEIAVCLSNLGKSK